MAPTFGQLLSEQMQRVGISDSELARAIGVQRQTIFRWKEGLVARPRERNDVLRIAQKLRLTERERDQLLLAAGFAPEGALDEQQPIQPVQELPPADESGEETAATIESDATAQISQPLVLERSRDKRWPLFGVLGLLIVLLVAGGLGLQRFLLTWTPTPTIQPLVYPMAAEDEILLLVADFTGYTSQQFNIAGRISEALASEIEQRALVNARVAHWPLPIRDPEQAQEALMAAHATLIVWGEYDSGRVRANLTLSEALPTSRIDFALTSADDLATTINEAVPAEVRMFVLLTIGNLYPHYPLDDFYSSAAATFRQALELQPSRQSTRALLNFYLALAVSQAGTLPAIEEAINHYTQAINLHPRLFDALYNRGTLWLNRAYLVEAGSVEIENSLTAAIADFDQTLAHRPNYANAQLNRGIAYYERQNAGDLAASQQDFDRFIEQQPTDLRGYYHRALALIRQGDNERWVADLETTLNLSPTYASAYNAFCWGYGLAEKPELALPYCEQAVALDPTGASYDGQGIALAQLGRYDEAIVALEAYLAWLRTLQPPTQYNRLRGPQISQWLAQLRAGQNPFTRETLVTLR